jgi:hypothetical protein
VRIRLELNRKRKRDPADKSGWTKVMIYKKWYVGFSRQDFKDSDFDKATLQGSQIAIPGKVFRDAPESGDYTYDYDGADPNTIHRGNKVTLNPTLPDGITEANLIDLAKKALALDKDIELTAPWANKSELASAIKKEITGAAPPQSRKIVTVTHPPGSNP